MNRPKELTVSLAELCEGDRIVYPMGDHDALSKPVRSVSTAGGPMAAVQFFDGTSATIAIDATVSIIRGLPTTGNYEVSR